MKIINIIVSALSFYLINGEKLIFEDEFNFFDPRKWSHEITSSGGGNNAFQIFTPDSANSYCKDGILFIRPTPTVYNINPSTGRPFGDDYLTSGFMNLTMQYGNCTNAQNNGCVRNGAQQMILPIMSASLVTTNKFSFQYGRLEAIAKMPAGDWMWPAIWLMPEDSVYGGWPRSGEIDLVESIGNRNLTYNDGSGYGGVQRIGSTLHWGPAWDDEKYYLTHSMNINDTCNYANCFHNYTMDWDENGIRFIIDGKEIGHMPDPLISSSPNWKGWWEYGIEKGGGWKQNSSNPWVNGTKMAPFDRPFYLIMVVAVGGTNGFMPDSSVATNNGGYPKPYSNSDSDAAQGKFWEARDQWYPTWQGEMAALQVKSIRVYKKDTQFSLKQHNSGRMFRPQRL